MPAFKDNGFRRRRATSKGGTDVDNDSTSCAEADL
jgi:hypothetical protein